VWLHDELRFLIAGRPLDGFEKRLDLVGLEYGVKTEHRRRVLDAQ